MNRVMSPNTKLELCGERDSVLAQNRHSSVPPVAVASEWSVMATSQDVSGRNRVDLHTSKAQLRLFGP